MHDDGHSHANHHDLGGRDEYLSRRSVAPTRGPRRVRRSRRRAAAGARQQGDHATDELRRCVEAIPREEYFRLQYYERWLRAITAVLLEKRG